MSYTNISFKQRSITVNLFHSRLLSDLDNWLDDPELPKDMYGRNRKYKCLDSLVKFEGTLLAPYVFLEWLPLTIESVYFCFESCQFIYSLSRLVDFLGYLGVVSSRSKPISYNHVYPWPLHSLESRFVERSDYFFSDSSNSKVKRAKFLKLQLFNFIETTNFRSEFLERLEFNNF